MNVKEAVRPADLPRSFAPTLRVCRLYFETYWCVFELKIMFLYHLQYYCEHCWAMVHSRPGREFHKPLVKEGADRPRTVHFRWWSCECCICKGERRKVREWESVHVAKNKIDSWKTSSPLYYYYFPLQFSSSFLNVIFLLYRSHTSIGRVMNSVLASTATM